MRATYFVAIAVMCVLPSLLALVAYVVRKINPCWFRLSVALARVFSFSVEMESRTRNAREVAPASFLDRPQEEHGT